MSEPTAAGRHRDGSESPGDRWPRTTRLQVFIASFLLYAGRVLIPVTAALVIALRLSKPVWEREGFTSAGVPNDQLVAASEAVLMLFALSFPFLLLPVGAQALIEPSTGFLKIRTVLGSRVLRSPVWLMGGLYIPGTGGGLHLVLLANGPFRWAIVGNSDFWPDMAYLYSLGVSRRQAPVGEGGSRWYKRQIFRRGVGGVVALIVWVGIFFVLAALLLTAADLT